MKPARSPAPTDSATQWRAAADLKNRVFYYHTQYSRRVRMIDLKRIDSTRIGKEVISEPHDESRVGVTNF